MQQKCLSADFADFTDHFETISNLSKKLLFWNNCFFKEAMRPQKVIFLTYSLSTGGAERRLVSIANQFAARGAQVKIVLLDAPLVVFPVDPKVEVIFLEQEKQDWDLSKNTTEVKFSHCPDSLPASIPERLRLRFLKCFAKKRYAIEDMRLFLKQRYANRIHAFLQDYPEWTVVSFMSFCSVSTTMALSTLKNHTLFVECMSPEAEFPGEHPMNNLKRRYYPRAQGGIFQTDEERDFYSWLQIKKYVIPNPVSGHYPGRHEGVRRKVIVSFARIEKQKNFPLLIDSFAMLSKEHSDYSLSIYGEGSAKHDLIEYVQSLGLMDKVIFHDFDIALHAKIKDCAMFVSSSDREGISNSMLEAMAIGLPAICTDCPAGGARMMIQSRSNGMLVPVRDKQALCQAMKELIENPALAEKISRNSVKIREQLSIDKIARQWWAAVWEDEQ